MKIASMLVDTTLLRTDRNFRRVFVARLMSVLAFGLLTVTIPIQVHAMTGSTLQVGLVLALAAAGHFAGLMVGGVLADRVDRRRQILGGRLACGVGYAVLLANSLTAAPALGALHLLVIWDGFFGAIGMSALMAAIPNLVGRPNLPAAAALSMLVVRIGTVLAPAAGGVLIAAAGVEWNYALAAAGTLGTLLPLTGLPSLRPTGGPPPHPLRALAAGLRFVAATPPVGAVFALGVLKSMSGAIRVLFPALVPLAYGGGALEVGLMYAAFPAGAILGALTSGWVAGVRRPGLVMWAALTAGFAALTLLGLFAQLAAGMAALAAFGYAGSIAALLQFVLVQHHTPDPLLGRVNALWRAQEVLGDSAGAFGLGVLGKLLAPPLAALAFGGALLAAGAVSALVLLKHLRATPPETDAQLAEETVS